MARPGSLTGSSATVVRIWNGNSTTGIYVQKSRTDTQSFRLYKVVYQAAGGGGSGENNYLSGVTSSVAGQDVTLNFSREGLANLSTVFTVPGGGSITQATEATLGGMRGASALQAISSSGYDDSRLVGQPNRPVCIRCSPRYDASRYRQLNDGAQVRDRCAHSRQLMCCGGGGGTGDDAFDWAAVGNTDLVPVAKLGPGVATADRILRGNQTWGRINANTLTANFLNTGSPDEADYMLFADSGSGRPLSFITYGSFLDGIAGVGIAHGGETLHIDATGATTGQVYSYTGDGTTLNFDWVDLPTGVGTTVTANPSGTLTDQLLGLTVGSTDWQVRSTFSRKYLSDRPVADEDNQGHIYHVLKEQQAYISVEDSHQSSTPSGTFNNIPNRGDLHIVGSLPTNLNNLTTGDFYYHAGGDPNARRL